MSHDILGRCVLSRDCDYVIPLLVKTAVQGVVNDKVVNGGSGGVGWFCV